ncbi:RDD family protein [Acetivibrio cellulolyticus]|uniref:RDD family protein n=1 Tax=Acetivibrio cellulolyticus TaxID=35830 RepID=UPI0001E2C2B4|nr:RDD family protein [Acetivibrio cellulolyticus]
MPTYAGFWKRLVAIIIDAVILGIVDWILNGVLGQRLGSSFGALAGAVYFILMESSSMQGTVGKMAIGIKVTDLDGNRISTGKAIVRYIGKIISGIILFIGYIMAAFTANKQALHDMIASTLVVER